MTHSAQLRTLIAHQLRRRWRSLVSWGAALGALGALYVALFPSMSTLIQGYMDEAPEYIRRMLGDIQGPMTPEHWMGLEFFNMFVPVALPFLVMLIGARTIAGSEERKDLDLLLSNPFPRWCLVIGAVTTMAISLAAVLAATWVLTYVATLIAGVALSPGHLAMAVAALWPFCLLFGTLALFCSSLMRRGTFAVVVPAVILVVMYLIQLLSQMSKTMEPTRVVSLLYHLGHPVEGDFPWTAALAMLGGACILTAAAIAAFAKRDLYT